MPPAPPDSDSDDLGSYVESWVISLRAAKKSPATIKTYRNRVGLYLAWCRQDDRAPALDHATVTAYLADLGDEHASATVCTHLVAISSYARWLAKEEHTGPYDLAEIERPQPYENVIDPFTADELAALLRACTGRRLMDLRDTAIIHELLDFGGRARELVGQHLNEIDLRQGTALLHGKGGKDRWAPLGDATCEALDRYMRARRKHPRADSPRLWLGEHGAGFQYTALWQTLQKRGRAASIENVHPHRFRHTFADRWLDKGGSESGLMHVGGWTSLEMVQRYSKARAAQRALDEARRLNVGEL